MYRLNGNTFVGTDAERTGNNFKVGNYFVNQTTGEQYIKLLDGTWLLLQVASSGVPDPLTIGDLTVTNDANVNGTLTAGSLVGGGAAVTGLSATNIASGTLDGNSMTVKLKYHEDASLPATGVEGEVLVWFNLGSTWRIAVWFDNISNWKTATLA